MSVDPLDYFLQAYDKKSYANKSAESAKTAKKSEEKADKIDFSFADFIDVINPLQHIPVISSIYRNITGDEISEPAKLAGGALFAGLTGGFGLINLFSDFVTRKDTVQHLSDFTELALNNTKNANTNSNKNVDLIDDKSANIRIADDDEKEIKTETLAPIVMANEVDLENSFWLKS